MLMMSNSKTGSFLSDSPAVTEPEAAVATARNFGALRRSMTALTDGDGDLGIRVGPGDWNWNRGNLVAARAMVIDRC